MIQVVRTRVPPSRRGGDHPVTRARPSGRADRPGAVQDAVRVSVLAHVCLDRQLELLARRPKEFAEGALRLGLDLDARGVDLEISDPLGWRGTAISARVLFENQFTAEIAGIRLLDRKGELRLAQRIEFARIRLDRALEGLGLSAGELTGSSVLPPAARRRRLEWHALRLEMVERNLYLVLINVRAARVCRLDALEGEPKYHKSPPLLIFRFCR